MALNKYSKNVNFIFVLFLSAIFMSELLIMFFIDNLPPMSTWQEALLDATVLSIVSYPIVFYFSFKPLKKQIIKHEDTERELFIVNRTLQEQQKELEEKNFELKLANIALTDSNEKFSHLFDISPVSCLILSDKGLIIEVNETSKRILAAERENLLYRNFSQFLPSEEYEQWLNYFNSVLKNENKQSCKIIIKRDDDSVFYALMSCVRDNPLVSSNIYMTFSDITRENWNSFK